MTVSTATLRVDVGRGPVTTDLLAAGLDLHQVWPEIGRVVQRLRVIPQPCVSARRSHRESNRSSLSRVTDGRHQGHHSTALIRADSATQAAISTRRRRRASAGCVHVSGGRLGGHGNAAPISRLVRPAVISWATSNSRAVSGAQGALGLRAGFGPRARRPPRPAAAHAGRSPPHGRVAAAGPLRHPGRPIGAAGQIHGRPLCLPDPLPVLPTRHCRSQGAVRQAGVARGELQQTLSMIDGGQRARNGAMPRRRRLWSPTAPRRPGPRLRSSPGPGTSSG